ncbi:MAG TPA: hypothetical protein PLR99_24190, partial [Polyangiaceae bacterium]|nr:hypothetical protein [Polyangiaceae bacterium]
MDLRRTRRPRARRRAALALGAALAALSALACGRSFPTPFTASDLAREGSGAALTHYLHQPGATATVCDRRAHGDGFRGESRDDFEALAGGLLSGKVAPGLWQRCAMLMLESLPAGEAASLLDELAHAYRTLVSRSAVETDAAERARLEALHKTLLFRPRGTAPHPEAVADDVAKLTAALDKGRLGPIAARYGRDLLVDIDLGRGVLSGAPVTVATLDALFTRKDELLLRRVAQRVPDAGLRDEARRRIVRLHVAASASAHVRAHPDETQARVMAEGRNPVDLGQHAPTAGWVDEERLRVRGLLVRQNVWKQTSTLLAVDATARSAGGAQVLPSIELRGALFVRAAGFEEPLTVCAPPDALDVTPCVLPSEVRPAIPIVHVDAQGLLHFVERIATRDALKLVYNTPNLPLPFLVHEKELFTLEWPIRFERPSPIVFTGPTSGRGPDLRVSLQRRYSPRVLFEVTGPEGPLVGVVEAEDLDAFVIATRGGAGPAGARGTDGARGSNGSSGSSASCPGSPGTSGGAGG